MYKLSMLIFITVLFGCREKFIPPFDPPAAGYLVVEGNINSGDTTDIILTRSGKLTDQTYARETLAQLRIEGTDNSVYTLVEQSAGRYRILLPTLTNGGQYRLRINTRDGKEYLSDYVECKQTPEIDSLSWQREKEDGTQVYVNAHDDNNSSMYYKWEYHETWEFHANYQPNIAYSPATPNPPGIIRIDPDTSIYKCWNDSYSNQILIGTTVNLTRDRVYLPLAFTPRASVKMSVLYSIEVKQNVLSKQAYEFYEKLKKNTETTGSIFDAQPSNINGNIHCTTNPEETVIGFINVSTLSKKRLFIYNSQLPGWRYSDPCYIYDTRNAADSIREVFNSGAILLIPMEEDMFGNIVRFYYTYERHCMDCRVRGYNRRPSYWP